MDWERDLEERFSEAGVLVPDLALSLGEPDRERGERERVLPRFLVGDPDLEMRLLLLPGTMQAEFTVDVHTQTQVVVVESVSLTVGKL